MADMKDRLILMANQIARNLEVQGPDAAIGAVAEHITLYWDPRMKRQAAEIVAAGGEGLTPTALAALKQVSP